MTGKVVVFGATGAIGGAIADRFLSEGWSVTGTSRRASSSPGALPLLIVDPPKTLSALDTLSGLTAAVWAQGSNTNDSIYDVDIDAHTAMLQSNVVFVTATLNYLLRKGAFARGARMLVVSSIWQRLARQNKLSYTVSKAALHGLVTAAAVDLAKDDHLINALLPGVIDTPMTRKALSAEKIKQVESATSFGRLPSLVDVANTAHFLCSQQNTAVTGQSLTVDLGFSSTRLL